MNPMISVSLTFNHWLGCRNRIFTVSISSENCSNSVELLRNNTFGHIFPIFVIN